MIDTLRQLICMKATLHTNIFLYYLSRLFLIGKMVPDDVYGKKEMKQTVIVLMVIASQIGNFCGKAVYTLVFIMLPVLLFGKNGAYGASFASIAWIVFFMNGILGGLESHVYAVTREKYICIRYMKMNPEKYVKTNLLYTYVPFFIYFLPCILVCTKLCNKPLSQGVLLWFLLFLIRSVTEAAHVYLYDKKGILPSRSVKCTWILIVGCLAGAYLPVWLGTVPETKKWLFLPGVIGLLFVAGMLSLYYLFVGYRGYRQKMYKTVEEKWITSETVKNAKMQAADTEVGIKEKDMHLENSDEIRKKGMKGYEYFNELFFVRHRRQLLRPVYYRLCFVGLLFVGMILLRLGNRKMALEFCSQITLLLPTLVFVMYMISVAEKACKAMFYNCDKSMLKFGFYRNPDVIIKNFKIRLKRIAYYNAIVGAALSLSVIAFHLMCGYSPLRMDVILFTAAVLMLTVFFTVHHMFMYYIFQPYTENMRVKNPFFTVINFAVYVICYFCMKIQAGGLAFTAGVLIVTILYTGIALRLVYRFAPKRFRAK